MTYFYASADEVIFIWCSIFYLCNIFEIETEGNGCYEDFGTPHDIQASNGYCNSQNLV